MDYILLIVLQIENKKSIYDFNTASILQSYGNVFNMVIFFPIKYAIIIVIIIE